MFTTGLLAPSVAISLPLTTHVGLQLVMDLVARPESSLGFEPARLARRCFSGVEAAIPADDVTCGSLRTSTAWPLVTRAFDHSAVRLGRINQDVQHTVGARQGHREYQARFHSVPTGPPLDVDETVRAVDRLDQLPERRRVLVPAAHQGHE